MNRLLTLTGCALLAGCNPGLGEARRDWQDAGLVDYTYQAGLTSQTSSAWEYAIVDVDVEAGVAEVRETNAELDPLLLSGMDGVLQWVRENRAPNPTIPSQYTEEGVPTMVFIDSTLVGPGERYVLQVELLEAP